VRARTIAFVAVSTLASAARLPAAEGVLRTEVDARRIGLDDQVQLTITAEGGALPDEVALPALTNLRLAGGPAVSTQMSFVNGRMSQARSWTYQLQPLAVGRAEVGAVKARFGGGEESAPAIPIEVDRADIDIDAYAADDGNVDPRQDARLHSDYIILAPRHRAAARARVEQNALEKREAVVLAAFVLVFIFHLRRRREKQIQRQGKASANQYSSAWAAH